MSGPLVVIVVVEADDDEALDVALAHATAGLEEHFPTHDGFLGGQLHRDPDARRLLQRVVWRDLAAWEACRDDAAWDDVATSVALARVMEAGRLWLEVDRWHGLLDVPGP